MQSNITKKPRLDIIDALKGYAIVLVIMGHVIVWADPLNFTQSRLFTFIYSFHMPLMLVLSGYLSNFSHITSKIKFIQKKFMILIVPYFLWNFIGIFIANNFTINDKLIRYMMNKFIAYDNLWFLPVLFISFILLLGYIRFEREMIKINFGKYAMVVFVAIFEFIIWSVPPSFNGVHQLGWFPVFVLMGYILAKYKDKFYSNEHLYQISILTFIFLLPLWSITVINFSETSEIQYFINFTLAITGIIMAYKFIKSLKNTKIYRFFIFLGIFSLEIYMVSNILPLIMNDMLQIHLWLGDGIIAIISGTIAYVILSIVIVLILSYNKKISLVLFGRWTGPAEVKKL